MVLLLAAVTVADGVAATSGAGSDLVGQLAGLAELHRTGDLTADEFVLAKQRVLAAGASVSDVVAAAPPPLPPHGADRYDVVADFGAKGDGVADDTKSLQAGIDAVSAATRRFLILFCVCVCMRLLRHCWFSDWTRTLHCRTRRLCARARCASSLAAPIASRRRYLSSARMGSRARSESRATGPLSAPARSMAAASRCQRRQQWRAW